MQAHRVTTVPAASAWTGESRAANRFSASELCCYCLAEGEVVIRVGADLQDDVAATADGQFDPAACGRKRPTRSRSRLLKKHAGPGSWRNDSSNRFA
jgi:hypothetical protein